MMCIRSVIWSYTVLCAAAIRDTIGENLTFQQGHSSAHAGGDAPNSPDVHLNVGITLNSPGTAAGGKDVRSSALNPSVAKITTETVGAPGTLEWRMFFYDRGEDGTKKRISPWHDIPLKNDDGTYNFLCEIPKWTRKKNEVATDEEFNPIKQDTKNGKLREYNHGDMVVNYGAFPQTWEDPNHISEGTGYKGDNDPLDVMEVGMREREVGSITAVKILGVIAMIDDEETDWKVLVLAKDDPVFDKIDNLEDLEKYMPNAAMRLTEWLQDYKIVDGKPPNKFGFNKKPQDKEYAIGVIEKQHELWKKRAENQRSTTVVNLDKQINGSRS